MRKIHICTHTQKECNEKITCQNCEVFKNWIKKLG